MSIPFLPQVSGSEPVYLHMQVTPKMAAEWLAYNEGNRRPSEKRVVQLVQILTAGEWEPAASHVSFSATRLIDGQHRLTAISRMPDGFSVKVGIFINVPESAQRHIDCGWTRTLAQRASVEKELAACVRWMSLCTHGQLRIVTPSVIESTYAQYGPMLDWVCAWPTNKGIARTQVRVAAGYLFLKDQGKAKEFFDLLFERAVGEMSHPAVQLRKKINEWLISRKFPDPMSLYAYACSAVNAINEGRSLTKIYKASEIIKWP
jgi:hypothetical protein